MIRTDRRLFVAGALALTACGKKEPPEATPATAPAAAAPPPPITPITDAGSLKALLDAQLAETKIPALAAAVFDADDFRLSAATGVRFAKGTDPVQITDPWHLGSCTKAMTSALYARLVEAGKARWGATAAELLPDIAGEMDAAWRDTPVEAFMRHRSGLTDVDVPWLIQRRTDRRALAEQRSSTVRGWLIRPPGGKPGEFAYCNLGYVVVGAAIERITKKPWEDAMREHVFGPLKMDDAGFGPPQGAAPQGHREGLLGRDYIPVGTGVAADNPPALGPAGTVHATFEDWAKFVRVFFDKRQTFLSAENVQRLTTPEAGQNYALGWGDFEHPVGGHVIGHTGSNTMWMTHVMIQPQHGLASLVATNCGGAAAERATRPVMSSLLDSSAKGLVR